VRLTFVLASIVVAIPAAAISQQLPTLTPAQAISRAAAAPSTPVRAVVQLKVESAAAARGGYYLDSQKDFHSAANLGIAIRASAVPGLTKKYGADLKAAFVGKTIKVIGQVHRRAVAHGTSTATEIEVTHAGQILAVS
jgi:hypothetical protein